MEGLMRQNSSRSVGFSTGAIAKGDFRSGVEEQPDGSDAIELSALREHELEPLLAGIGSLDLRAFKYVSVHAPSRLAHHDESWLVERLAGIPSDWPIVVHPDLIKAPLLWRSLGSRLCLENMDIRKPTGRIRP